MRARLLAANELLKARRRSALWVSLGGFTGLMLLIYGAMRFGNHGTPDPDLVLPRGWGEIVGGPGNLAVFFAAITIILLVSSEFTWRTARQNVIDGLSKEEFFAAKLLLVPALALLFFTTLLAIGGGFAVSGSQAVRAAAPLFRREDAVLIGGALLGLLGWCSLAFLLAITVRSSGPALGVFFLYVLVEKIVADLLGLMIHGAGPILRFLPVSVFTALWDAKQYAIVPPRPGQPPMTDTWALLGAGATYVAVFVTIGFALYRRRDL